MDSSSGVVSLGLGGSGLPGFWDPCFCAVLLGYSHDPRFGIYDVGRGMQWPLCCILELRKAAMEPSPPGTYYIGY